MGNALTGCFIAALVLVTALRLWLAQRQIRHVRAHRAAVPAGFAGVVPLAAHQTAADYAVAKTKLGIADLAIGVGALLVLTLGGGLQALSDALARLLEAGGLWHGTALIVAVALLLSLVELPIGVWH